MARRLPSLNALRAFEASARHLSIAKAAAELHVTPAAVSHQIKNLETYLGVLLFKRGPRRLSLTEAGLSYLPDISNSFDLIDAATARLRRFEADRPIRVSVLPSFAAKWLLPRLSRFRERHPGIDILVHADNHVTDFTRDEIDVALRFGGGTYPGLYSERIMGDEALVVCSPSLTKGAHPLKTPRDLAHHTLLHDTMTRANDELEWWAWLRLGGVTDLDASRGPGYSDTAMAIQAAIRGEGVAIARRSIAIDDMKAGLLVSPFGPVVPLPQAYFFVTPRVVDEGSRIAAFRDWIMSEANEAPDTACPEEAVGLVAATRGTAPSA